MDDNKKDLAEVTAKKAPGKYIELDISDELYRDVYLANGNVHRINAPKRLFMREGGSTHRVTTEDGSVYCYADPSTGKSMVVWKVEVEKRV